MVQTHLSYQDQTGIRKKEILKAHLRKLGCLVKYSFHGGLFKVSNSLIGHPIAYGKFVMNKHMKAEKT